jgi:hypothetical protein
VLELDDDPTCGEDRGHDASVAAALVVALALVARGDGTAVRRP